MPRVFPIVCKSEFGRFRVMLEVTRGQVDNENNNQGQYSNMSIHTKLRVLYMESESIAIRMRISEV